MNNAAEKMLNLFNDEGWDSIQPFFGDFDTFYKYLKKNNIFEQLDVNKIPNELLNQFFLSSMMDNPTDTLDTIINLFFTDIEKKGNDYYLKLINREEVAEFFYDKGRDNSKDIVSSIMSEDDWWEPYIDTTNDVYVDVIEELNPNNLNYLKEIILKELNGVAIDIDSQSSELMEQIASEQGNENHFFVTPDNIDEIVDDSETMNILLDNELNDIKSNLYTIHSLSFNDAYRNKIWNDVMKELSTYFEPSFHEEYIKFGDKTRINTYIKINNLSSIIIDFLSEFRNSDYDVDWIDYNGSFTGLLKKMMEEVPNYDKLDFRIPYYPDSTEVDKNINEYFNDYI